MPQLPPDEAPPTEAWLFRTLLRAARAPLPLEHLTSALGGLVRLTGAERAHLEVTQPLTQARWTLQHGCDDEHRRVIQAATSRGVIAAALASGQTIQTASALLDDRFRGLRSVQSQQLEAVLCVPIPGRLTGVLYLEGQRGAEGFTAAAVELTEEVAAALGLLLEQVVTFERGQRDATAAVRARLPAPQVIGRSEALARVLERVAMAAPLDITVLLTGEPGTGKSQLAQLLHASSRRAPGPFVELNCAAIPETLLESELFGTTAGAFTSAQKNPGKVEAAQGGTLFLDEVGELSAPAQGKLLQLLQSKQYYALGSNRLVQANFRLVAATNADLEGLVAEKRFREDLFYRLNVLAIRVPSLKERPEDIGPLVDQLLPLIAEGHGLPRLEASPGLRTQCELESWPGNVRQLRNRLEVAYIEAVAEGAGQVELRHLDPVRAAGEEPTSFHAVTRAFQREFLRQRLVDANWNVTEVARRLELTRAHIYNLVRSLRIEFRP